MAWYIDFVCRPLALSLNIFNEKITVILLIYHYLSSSFGLKIPSVFTYSSTRMMLAALTALVLTILLGPRCIKRLYELKTGQSIRVEDCPLLAELHQKKKDTPTMGGILIIFSMLVSMFLWMDLKSSFTLILLITTVWLAAIGGWDDYLKLRYKNSKGMRAKKKFLLQILLGGIISVYLYCPAVTQSIQMGSWFEPPVAKEQVMEGVAKLLCPEKSMILRQFASGSDAATVHLTRSTPRGLTEESGRKLPQKGDFAGQMSFATPSVVKKGDVTLSTQQYMSHYFVPLYKDPILILKGAAVILGVLFTIFVLTGSSNAVNLTDGLDGLASGCLVMAAAALGLLAFFSNNIEIAHYLNILYIDGSGEIGVYLFALVGACLGFLWYNGYPAQMFMGDTGSLALGGVIGISAILLRREILFALIGGIFVAEAMSVILQVGSYKLRNKKRIFLCAPLHHHFEYKGWPETKVVLRFWIISLILAIVGIALLKFQ